VGSDGARIPGARVIDSVCERILANNRNPGRREQLLRYRMGQISAELAQRPDGDRVLAEFATHGPVPA
jgi:hypothetical protein